jgi:hypothetical protein
MGSILHRVARTEWLAIICIALGAPRGMRNYLENKDLRGDCDQFEAHPIAQTLKTSCQPFHTLGDGANRRSRSHLASW